MSTLRLSLAVAAILAVATPVRHAWGQIFSGASNGKHSGPFIEPDTFHPDFQFFAPADVTDYEQGTDVEPNQGFYFQYERIYMNVSRSDAIIGNPQYNIGSTDFDGDFTWGNRLEMGFIDCNDQGWQLVGMHIDGPNETRNFWGFNPNYPRTGIEPGYFGIQDAIRFNGGDLTLTDSINLAKFTNVELNRTFERQFFHNGGVFEPFVGVRYSQFRDRFIRSDYATFDTDFDFFADVDQLVVAKGAVENNMLGIQGGFRIFKEVSHWKLNTEFRGFAMQNWQFFYGTSYADQSSANAFAYVIPPTTINFDDASVCWGGEFRADCAYKVTRDISLRVGVTLLQMAKVGRSDVQVSASNFNQGTFTQAMIDQQDVFMGGVSFGFEVNR